MKDEKSLLVNIVALAILLVFAYFTYTVCIDNKSGAKISDAIGVQSRVANEYLHKNVTDENSKYKWQGTAEDTSANIVTSVVTDYRLFDTTLEVIVLFVTILAFGFITPDDRKIIKRASGIIYNWAPILMIFILLVGGYMFINGHLSPGGGFPAGAIMSTAILVEVLSGRKTVSPQFLKTTEAISGVMIFLIGILSYFITGNFFQNFITGDKIGNLFSAGLIPVFYTLIAFKVGAEPSNIYFGFYKEG